MNKIYFDILALQKVQIQNQPNLLTGLVEEKLTVMVAGFPVLYNTSLSI